MIDIHSHILPGVDDGSRSMEESLEMLGVAAASGTTDIVATPHSNNEFLFDQAQIRQRFQELATKASGLINVHLGCDFHLSFDNLQKALSGDLRLYTVNNGRYLMVELPDLVALPSMRVALRQLIQAEAVPIITHPERNSSLQPRLHELEAWIQDGCLVQVTGQSLTGRFGPMAQRAAELLMNTDLVHFIASDAHDCIDRSPDLSQAYAYVSSRYGTERADRLLLHNPAAVLWSESIDAKPRRKSGIFKFWK